MASPPAGGDGVTASSRPGAQLTMNGACSRERHFCRSGMHAERLAAAGLEYIIGLVLCEL